MHSGSTCGLAPGWRASCSERLFLPLQRKPLQQIIQLQLRRLPPVEDRLHDLRREQRQPQNPADVGRRARPSPGPDPPASRARPSSSIFRHRNARASALTMALSTRGRGAHSAPSGVTTSFRPPRFRNVERDVHRDRLRVRRDRRPPAHAPHSAAIGISGRSTSCPQLAHPGRLPRAKSSRNGPRLQASMIG